MQECDSNTAIIERGQLYMWVKRLRMMTFDPPCPSFHKNWVKSGINISKVNWERLEWRACVHMCAHLLMCREDYGIRLLFDKCVLCNFSCITRSSSSVNFWSQDWLLTGFQWVCPTTVLSSFRTALISSVIIVQNISNYYFRAKTWI